HNTYKNEVPNHLVHLYEILCIADMTSSSTGEVVTFEKRFLDINNRYGSDSLVTVHARDLLTKVNSWLLELQLSYKKPDSISILNNKESALRPEM
ncbi:hypothetical protein, partial [Lysinibacillus xylanilyticus]|uniref:hypothetical protein n=1 Tax=Lysinibacillus xylanilyticus TaxID=582475 RepID=UPI0036DF01D4